MKYVELQVTSNFTFLRGASHPDELMATAMELGYTQIAITDRNTLAGIVRAHAAAKALNIRLIAGCRLDLVDGPSLLVYPTNLDGYSLLSQLLTTGNLRTEKGKCLLRKEDVYNLRNCKYIVVPPQSLTQRLTLPADYKKHVAEYARMLGPDLYIGMSRYYMGGDLQLMYRLNQLAQELKCKPAATNDVHYHIPQRRELQDVLTCIREKCTIHTAGYRLLPNAERHIKPAREMERLFRQYPQALQSTVEIAAACTFSLDELQYEYPHEVVPKGKTPQQELTKQAWLGAKKHYGKDIPEKVINNLKYELSFIKRRKFAYYFLTVWDLVREARARNILCQGRGSAANSTVCFCLGVTGVDPTKFNLLFERFVSDERKEPPDIDVDFEHSRREEIMQYVYEKYGRDRAAIVATVVQVHYRGAVRDVAKVMGVSADTINKLAKISTHHDTEVPEHRLQEQGIDPSEPLIRKVLDLTLQYRGFPRQLGQHTGGFVISNQKLSALCPILNARMEDRTNIEWNKDDIDALGFMKVDVLSLGMLTCIKKSYELIEQEYGLKFTLSNVPQDDEKVYEMFSHADTIGVFQIESRAQMSMLPRLKPKNFYDLVIEVAIVRPGPIVGNMVHPYLKRREHPEQVTYPSKELEEILKKTLGVPLFQEQAMQVAIVAADFTGAEADQLRRSMATFKMNGILKHFEIKLIEGMKRKGYSEEYARNIFRQLEGFGSYGFPESHAASFAHLVYISGYIKYHYPEVFACALLNSMPMGFYQPAQIIQDAIKHGVIVKEVDINYSSWDNTLVNNNNRYRDLRLGFRQVRGLRQADMDILVSNRPAGGYKTIAALVDAGIPLLAVEKLALADAFNSIGLDRRNALWEVTALKDRPTGMYTGQAGVVENTVLPAMTDIEHVVEDYETVSLSLRSHPVSFVAKQLKEMKVVQAAALSSIPDGTYVRVAGLIIVRQRPGTAKGVTFLTLEDSTGFINLVVFANVYEAFRPALSQSSLLMVEGKLQREGEVIHIIAESCYNITGLLNKTLNNARGNAGKKEEQQLDMFDNSRNFR
ncbi:error-prone DNA polymerase [Chitinophaga terrae (ex Kim and Jung 2007)]|uniref:error-prone DNA polymerase n=1 Tax=Chitinophaga terrae (ex Kim and Jung 2007) TaxID=408074 RepID=UPI0027805435|nr:error-prone DNA polymerase [Chitinophaga terrae (ex Kim and Jung 2007)]MDQ0107400.1 error-prone DNA polymerase [Chitinophaga terrae (ex Kim and Jung 2007)]